ncbi:cytochrome P450 [Actinoplanes sp. NBRC 101535]|uniref:cytochrome P450 n=1 Tax=Actinoplanes sp. NBRC 101535 TaxID=3032196 RepID=UPI0024A47D65|nr:cytochrome P450 [Actinoplanes sp. NBRC 101535]GLY01332.1 fatty-acid peroxygenase [Actinoplanes sp. NBRC 101535]
MADLDQTLALALKGYAWLPDLRRRSPGEPVRIRVMGQPAVVICGPSAARFFYGHGNLERHSALPGLVVRTLFGRGAVHTLDDEAHRHRKALFTSLLLGDGIERLAGLAGTAFDEAAPRWRGETPVRLFDATAGVLTTAVSRWVGVPQKERERAVLASDLIAMVDGFATVGPRAARAMIARRRQEHRFSKIIAGVRSAPPTSDPLSVIAHHTDDGELLDPRTAAVELLNIIRPTAAVTWFVTFAAHALDRWPRHLEPLRAGDEEHIRAFVHEVRRFYPFAPFLGGRATRDLYFRGEPIAAGTLVLLDVYGQNHDPELWEDPYLFRPERFAGRVLGEFDLIPQGGGDPRTGHRCPGEQITIALLETLLPRLARLDHYLPPQNTDIDLSRIPARPRDRIQMVFPDWAPARDHAARQRQSISGDR